MPVLVHDVRRDLMRRAGADRHYGRSEAGTDAPLGQEARLLQLPPRSGLLPSNDTVRYRCIHRHSRIHFTSAGVAESKVQKHSRYTLFRMDA